MKHFKIIKFLILILILVGCESKIDKNIDDVNLKKCLNNTNYKNEKSINSGLTVFDDMRYILNKTDEKNVQCYLEELGISKHTNKIEAIQRIHDFITIHQEYQFDAKNNDEGVKSLEKYILDEGGDCEDKAMFALVIMKAIGINPYVIDVDKINNGLGHVALALTDGIFVKNEKLKEFMLSFKSKEDSEKSFIPFDPADGKRVKRKIGQGIIYNKYVTKKGENSIYKYYFEKL